MSTESISDLSDPLSWRLKRSSDAHRHERRRQTVAVRNNIQKQKQVRILRRPKRQKKRSRKRKAESQKRKPDDVVDALEEARGATSEVFFGIHPSNPAESAAAAAAADLRSDANADDSSLFEFDNDQLLARINLEGILVETQFNWCFFGDENDNNNNYNHNDFPANNNLSKLATCNASSTKTISSPLDFLSSLSSLSPDSGVDVDEPFRESESMEESSPGEAGADYTAKSGALSMTKLSPLQSLSRISWSKMAAASSHSAFDGTSLSPSTNSYKFDRESSTSSTFDRTSSASSSSISDWSFARPSTSTTPTASSLFYRGSSSYSPFDRASLSSPSFDKASNAFNNSTTSPSALDTAHASSSASRPSVIMSTFDAAKRHASSSVRSPETNPRSRSPDDEPFDLRVDDPSSPTRVPVGLPWLHPLAVAAGLPLWNLQAVAGHPWHALASAKIFADNYRRRLEDSTAALTVEEVRASAEAAVANLTGLSVVQRREHLLSLQRQRRQSGENIIEPQRPVRPPQSRPQDFHLYSKFAQGSRTPGVRDRPLKKRRYLPPDEDDNNNDDRKFFPRQSAFPVRQLPADVDRKSREEDDDEDRSKLVIDERTEELERRADGEEESEELEKEEEEFLLEPPGNVEEWKPSSAQRKRKMMGGAKAKKKGEEVGEEKGEEEKKNHRGRRNGCSLWRFLYDLLQSPSYNPEIIRWENEGRGVFKIVSSTEVARLWGIEKENPEMTYEKMSRALRYYYRRQVLEPVEGRRLIYKFGIKTKIPS